MPEEGSSVEETNNVCCGWQSYVCQYFSCTAMRMFLRVTLSLYGRHDLSASEEKVSELKDLLQGYRRIILG
jgi:hypothetical protein